MFKVQLSYFGPFGSNWTTIESKKSSFSVFSSSKSSSPSGYWIVWAQWPNQPFSQENTSERRKKKVWSYFTMQENYMKSFFWSNRQKTFFWEDKVRNWRSNKIRHTWKVHLSIISRHRNPDSVSKIRISVSGYYGLKLTVGENASEK